jgi:hypothetical protein
MTWQTKAAATFRALAFIATAIIPLATPSAYPAPAQAIAVSNGNGVFEAWDNTLFQGRKVGFSYMRVEKGEKGYQVTARAALKLTLMGLPQDMSFTSEAALSPDGRLEKFSYLQTMQDQRQNIRATVKDGLIQMTISGAGGNSQTSVKAPPDVTLAHVAEYFFFRDLALGKEKSYPVFLEAMRAVTTMRMKVLGKKSVQAGKSMVEVFEVESEMQGVKSLTYVTADGRALSGTSLMGISFQETTADDAVKLAGVDVPVTSLITFSLITPDKPIDSPDTLKTLRLTIHGLSAPDVVEDGRQTPGEPRRVLGKNGERTFSVPLVIHRITPSATITIVKAGAAFPGDTKPTPEIQSDNKMMIKVAGEIVGAEANSWEAAKKINHWVFVNVKKEFVDSFTAIDVLLSKRGECQSHTNLFVALARAAGIPARVAGGIVYSKANHGFLYHAWPEVYVGEWVAMDPTLGQETADPTHVKLIEGGVESLMALLRYITRISITIDGAE